MSVAELLPTLHELGREDKLRVMQFLKKELAVEDNALIVTDQDYPVWSPHDAFDAADVLLRELADDRSRGTHAG